MLSRLHTKVHQRLIDSRRHHSFNMPSEDLQVKWMACKLSINNREQMTEQVSKKPLFTHAKRTQTEEPAAVVDRVTIKKKSKQLFLRCMNTRCSRSVNCRAGIGCHFGPADLP